MVNQLAMFQELPVMPPESNEWYTPPDYIEAARTVMGGIDLDPMTCEQAQAVVQAARYFTAADDGLVQDWNCETLWLNPPYGRGIIDRSVEKFLDAWHNKHIRRCATLLVNSCTDTGWYHSLMEACASVCFPKGRLKFWGPNPQKDGPRLPQTVFFFLHPQLPCTRYTIEADIALERLFKSTFEAFGCVLDKDWG